MDNNIHSTTDEGFEGVYHIDNPQSSPGAEDGTWGRFHALLEAVEQADESRGPNMPKYDTSWEKTPTGSHRQARTLKTPPPRERNRADDILKEYQQEIQRAEETLKKFQKRNTVETNAQTFREDFSPRRKGDVRHQPFNRVDRSTGRHFHEALGSFSSGRSGAGEPGAPQGFAGPPVTGRTGGSVPEDSGGVGRPSVARLTPFDGTSEPLETFLARFENFSSYFAWGERERLFHLQNGLGGSVGNVLWDSGIPHSSAE